MDDLPLVRVSETQFAWKASFFAGRVEVIAVDNEKSEDSYYLEVAPANQKVDEDGFASMVEAIRRFDQRLLLGQTAACLGFGRTGASGKFDELIRWERLRRHGSAFLKSVEAIVRMPHASLKPIAQEVPLAQVKRLPVGALKDRRIVAVAAGQLPPGENVDTIQVQVQVATATVDTAANRALYALLKRFRQALAMLKDWAKRDRGELSDAEVLGRRIRRLDILQHYDDEVSRLLGYYPFRGVKKSETTSAGLTQIAANPAYARAYRKGTEALRRGVEQDNRVEDLRVSPSWGVYETWCLVALAEALESLLGVALKSSISRFAKADLTLSAKLPDDRSLELLFQATFGSDGLGGSQLAWSLSRERRPDLVLIVSHENEHRMLVLDAKYRSGRTNVLDAMASAHIYHDSLFLAGRRPDMCLLLLPGLAEIASLENAATWNSFGVGTVSGYSVTTNGIQRCVDAISEWLSNSGRDR
ncbi:DUF2357 domain-containing protein [Paraburkholderia dilworthii]|uniref:DUF2357 domain-containing protein n=1 Tax=Paraburkholderia dilworthii TaxID=948106 RepID=A0ABW9DGA0_9BURK